MPPVAERERTGDDAPCPCGGRRYGDCCGPVHRGTQAATAEALMRARYSAFALGDEAFLHASWHPSTRPARIELDPRVRWLGLRIRDRAAGGPDDSMGTVEFVARWRLDGRGHRQHELSEFVREDGRWLYLRSLSGND